MQTGRSALADQLRWLCVRLTHCNEEALHALHALQVGPSVAKSNIDFGKHPVSTLVQHTFEMQRKTSNCHRWRTSASTSLSVPTRSDSAHSFLGYQLIRMFHTTIKADIGDKFIVVP